MTTTEEHTVDTDDRAVQAAVLAEKEYDASDVGRGQRLAEILLLKGTFLFTPWKADDCVWNSDRGLWVADEAKAAVKQAADLAQDHKELPSASLRALRAAVEIARSQEPKLTAPSKVFDIQPDLLAHPDGTTTQLSTSRRFPSRPSDHMTKATAVSPDSETPALVWEQFLQDVTQGDSELQLYLQHMAGHILVGEILSETAFFMVGPGGSGKSTLLRCLSAALGADLAVVVSSELITGTATENQVADLRGTRLAATEEVGRAARLESKSIKRIVSQGALSGRQLYQASATWMPTHTLVATVNHLPAVDAADSGVTRRVRAIPLTHQPAALDRMLPARLLEELPQILAWMVEGARLAHQRGYELPSCAKVETATKSWLEGRDILRVFADRNLLARPGLVTKRADLNAAWRDFCLEEGIRPWAVGSLIEALHERELTTTVEPAKVQGTYYVKGLALLPLEDGRYGDRALRLLRDYEDPRATPEDLPGTVIEAAVISF